MDLVGYIYEWNKHYDRTRLLHPYPSYCSVLVTIDMEGISEMWARRRRYIYDSPTTIAAKTSITDISAAVSAPNDLAAEVFGTDI